MKCTVCETYTSLKELEKIGFVRKIIISYAISLGTLKQMKV